MNFDETRLFLMHILIITFVRNEVDQSTLFYKPNKKKVRTEKKMDHHIS